VAKAEDISITADEPFRLAAARIVRTRTEELVARNVILPIGVRYSEQDCDDIGAAVRKVAHEVLS